MNNIILSIFAILLFSQFSSVYSQSTEPKYEVAVKLNVIDLVEFNWKKSFFDFKIKFFVSVITEFLLNTTVMLESYLTSSIVLRTDFGVAIIGFNTDRTSIAGK